MDELSRIERAVVEEERQLADQEALLVTLQAEEQDLTEAQAVLEMMREHHQLLDQDRQRLLALLHP